MAVVGGDGGVVAAAGGVFGFGLIGFLFWI